jgi:hypothetical protein
MVHSTLESTLKYTTTKSTTPAVTAEDGIAISDSQLVQYLSTKKGLKAKTLMPVLRPLVNAGLSQTQLDAIINIPYENGKSGGRHQKVYHFVEALSRVYNKDYLESLATNYKRFSGFVEALSQAEELRTDLAASRGDVTANYELCINLIHDLGLEETMSLYDKLTEESRHGESPVKKGVKALYMLKELVSESKKTGHSPEVLLDFARSDFVNGLYDPANDDREG